jgi:beta-alanine--pyruvate transaminase
MVRKGIYDAFMQGPERTIELFHGYTYSGHPLACAAALATLDVYRDEALFERAADLAPYWEDAIHSLKGEPHVIDVRNIGLIGAVELEPRPEAPAQRAYDAMLKAAEKGLMIRVTGDIIAMSPPLTITRGQIDTIVEILRDTLRELD